MEKRIPNPIDRKSVQKALDELRATLYSIGDGVIVTDTECRVTRINRVAEGLTGWKEYEAKGQDLDVVFLIANEQTGAKLQNPAKLALQQGKTVELVQGAILIAKDGTKIPIADCAAPIFDETGSIIGSVLVFHDQTNERKMQKALQESEELHRITIENINDPVFITDDDGKFVFVCSNVAHALGYSSEEMKINNSIAAYLGDGTPLFDLDDLRNKGEILNIETYIIHKDGSKRDYLVSVRQVSIKDGTVLYVCRDITELKQVQKEKQSHLHFLKSLEKIDRAVNKETDVEKMLWAAVNEMLLIFGCDRVWLLHPCDLESSTWTIPIEVTRPEYPGAYELCRKVEMTPDVVETFKEVLLSEEPISGLIEKGEAQWDREDTFGVRSYLAIALHPKIGKSWQLGLHQCSYSRVWTDDEQKLFKNIGRRIEEALTNVLFLRGLKNSESLLKETQQLAKIGGWIWESTTGKVAWTDQVYEIYELPIDPDIDHIPESLKYLHPDDANLVYDAFRRAVDDGTPYDLELRLTTANGNKKWLRTMAHPEKADGRVVRITGNLIDITESRKAEQEQKKHLWFLENLECVDQAIKGGTDVETMLHEVVKTTFEIFGCDRAWLLHPCDPDAATFRVPVEVYNPEFPGGGAANEEIHMDQDDEQNIRDALATDGPCVYSPDTIRCIPEGTAERYHVKSSIMVAVYPKIGKPWLFGLHQCAYSRVWTEDEKKLFNEISRRLSDSLSSVLFLRDLEESEEEFRATFEHAPIGIAHVDFDGKWLKVNQKFCDIAGYTREELLQKKYQDITHPDDVDEDIKNYRKLTNKEVAKFHTEKRYIRKDESIAWIDLTVSMVCDAADNPAYFISVIEDITERKHMEQEKEKLQKQLLQAQKMESVGRLAGGVAHDFNNILSVILGYADMALDRLGPEDLLYEDIKEIKVTGQRAADLTRQLLAFARKQTVTPEVVGLNKIVGNLLVMLKRLIGENIDLAWLPGDEPWLVKVDAAQVDQILANLCVNARDAIEKVGKITIETANSSFNAAYCIDNPGFIPGEYVQLAVSDNGCGMEKEIVDNLFEPFFTTKPQGEGTGLGLSTVYGIVKQNSGFINVYSEPGKGTTVRVYFPRHYGALSEGGLATKQTSVTVTGNETILLVEDEPALLSLSRRMLENMGYDVIPANGPRQAIELAREYSGQIDLLITDVIMPEMNGSDLCQNLTSANPGLKTLFMSGYTANIIAHHGVLEKGVCFVQKPFSLNDLSLKIREALEKT